MQAIAPLAGSVKTECKRSNEWSSTRVAMGKMTTVDTPNLKFISAVDQFYY